MKKPKSSLEADKRLAAVLNSIGDVYYVLDRQWRMVMFNEATEAFIGRPRDEIRGRTIWDLYPYNPDSPFTPLLERAMLERQSSRLVSRSWLRPDRIVDFRVTPLGDEGIGVALVDVTELHEAEEHQRLLVNELNHRVKNTLAIVQAIAWQSFRGDGIAKQARETFEGRIGALAAAHDVLTRQKWEAGSIAKIVAGTLAPHDRGDGRLSATGPHVDLEPKTAVALALAMHELATNAVKYGALSTHDGRIAVCWSADDDRLHLTWRESDGPPIVGPIRRGFGARLLEQGLANELRGVVRLDFPPDGAVCELEAPLSA